MSIMNMIGNELMKYRQRTNTSPTKIMITDDLYLELEKEIEKVSGFKIDEKMTSYYGVQLEEIKGKNKIKVE